jgi:hypothetical protein
MAKKLEEILTKIKSNKVVQEITELGLFGASYINAALAQGDAYMTAQDPEWANPVLFQVIPTYLAEKIADAAGSETKAGKILHKAVDIGEYIMAGGNAVIALWYTPITGAVMRPAVDAIFGSGASANIDNALMPIYNANPTVPALLAVANLYAARRE